MPGSDTTIQANFEVDPTQTFALTVNSGANGSVADDTGTGPYNVEETVNISATADTGYQFLNWTGDTAGIADVNSANTTITMPASNTTITANFTPDFAGGDGSAGNPYQIETAQHLNNIRNFIFDNFVLNNDIDLNGFDHGDGKGWMPIGTSGIPFQGEIDGAGHKILNMTINRSGMANVGFLGYVRAPGNAVENIFFENADVTGLNHVGIVVGWSEDTDYNKIAVTGSVTGGLTGQTVGSFSGYIKDGVISDCYALADVSGSNKIGGFSGQFWNPTVSNCYFAGGITCAGVDKGGFSTYDDSGTYNDLFWDEEVSGVAGSAVGIGKTTAQMMQEATFTGWDFSTIWTTNGDTTYPEFQ